MIKKNILDSYTSPCAACRRIIDKTCPVTDEIQASNTICNYYKIITPTFKEKQNATR